MSISPVIKDPLFLNPLDDRFKALTQTFTTYRSFGPPKRTYKKMEINTVLHVEITTFLNLNERSNYYITCKALSDIWLQLKKRFASEFDHLCKTMLPYATKMDCDEERYLATLRYKVFYLPTLCGIRYIDMALPRLPIFIYNGDGVIVDGAKIGVGRYKTASAFMTFRGEMVCGLDITLDKEGYDKKFLLHEWSILKLVDGIPNLPRTYAVLHLEESQNMQSLSLCVQRFEGTYTLSDRQSHFKWHQVRLKTKYQITEKIIAAVRVLHQQGIIHRDIATRNVVISEEYEPCLLDFGMSSKNGEYLEVSFEDWHKDYLPHEVVSALNQKASDLANKLLSTFAADIFSLGNLICNILHAELQGDLLQLANDMRHRYPGNRPDITMVLTRFREIQALL